MKTEFLVVAVNAVSKREVSNQDDESNGDISIDEGDGRSMDITTAPAIEISGIPVNPVTTDDPWWKPEEPSWWPSGFATTAASTLLLSTFFL